MKLRTILLTSFIFISLFVVFVIGVMLYQGNKNLKNNYEELSLMYEEDLISALEANSDSKQAEVHLLLFFVFEDEIDREKFFLRHKSLEEQLAILDSRLKNGSKNQINYLIDMKLDTSNILSYGEELLENYDSDPENFNLKNNEIAVRGLHNSTSRIRKSSLEIFNLERQNSLEKLNSARENFDSMKEGIFLLIIITLFSSVVLGFILSYKLTRPIKKLSYDVDEIVNGKLDVQLKESNIFEIQMLTDSLKRVLASLKLAILRTKSNKQDLGIGLDEAVQDKKEAEEKYKALYEASGDAIMTCSPPSWKFTEGNPATIKMFGAKDNADFISRAPWEYSPKYQPDKQLSIDKAKKMIMVAMKRGNNYFKWTHKRLNGEEFPATVLLTKVKVLGKDLIQATVRDLSKGGIANEEIIREKKEVEKKLSEKSEQIALQSEIVRNMAEGAYLVGLKDLKIKYTNPKFEKMFGYNPGEMIGQNASIVNYPGDKDPKKTAKEIMSVIYKTKEWHGEVKNVKKDGTPFWSFANVSTFKHPKYGDILVAVHRDITKEKNDKNLGKKIKPVLGKPTENPKPVVKKPLLVKKSTEIPKSVVKKNQNTQKKYFLKKEENKNIPDKK